jgi:hypothetical protein
MTNSHDALLSYRVLSFRPILRFLRFSIVYTDLCLDSLIYESPRTYI